ncbi:MAG: flagellar biosynthesis anti-sigma factor FlgM [Gemmataceae bacterium]
MRDATNGRWRWDRVRSTPAPGASNRLPRVAKAPALLGSDEVPGPDGIRHELVARIRREIAAGTYDTEEKWLAAEEALLRRIERGM